MNNSTQISSLFRYLPWALVAVVAFIFLQSLPFKFGLLESPETPLIFNTIGNWMGSIGLPEFITTNFASHGGFLIGSFELLAVILLVIPKTRFWGALLGLGLMSGAIFFHLFTPLGVNRIIDEAGNTDGGLLFTMACIAWLSCAVLAYTHRRK